MQGPRNSRKLTKGEFNLRIGDGARVAAVAIGTYVLNLPCVFFKIWKLLLCPNIEEEQYFWFHVLNKRVLCNFVQWLLHYDVNYARGTLKQLDLHIGYVHSKLNVNDNKRSKDR